MAIQIQKPNEAETYVPRDEDENDPKRAEFQMTKLPARQKAKIRDGMVGLSKKGRISKLKSNQVSLSLVLKRLSGWNGIVDGGSPVDFDPNDVEGSFDLLPDAIQDELLEEFGSSGSGEEDEDGEDGPLEDSDVVEDGDE